MRPILSLDDQVIYNNKLATVELIGMKIDETRVDYVEKISWEVFDMLKHIILVTIKIDNIVIQCSGKDIEKIEEKKK